MENMHLESQIEPKASANLIDLCLLVRSLFVSFTWTVVTVCVKVLNCLRLTFIYFEKAKVAIDHIA